MIEEQTINQINSDSSHDINKIDSPGDEGEIFANLVQGNLLSEQELQALKSENDTLRIRI